MAKLPLGLFEKIVALSISIVYTLERKVRKPKEPVMILEIRYTAEEKKQLESIRKRFEAFKTSNTIDVCTPMLLKTETMFDGKQSAPWVVFSRNANFKQGYFYEALLGGGLYARTEHGESKRVEVASETEALARCSWHMAEELLFDTVAVPSWARTSLSRHSVSMANEMAPIWACAAKRTFADRFSVAV
jgi:hypothetical protein